ncbi:MAG: PHP domain-containing protein [Candidatus Pacebacteria bacterium]|nr:PHP domain-containing protein [Candidatus Paceibacterota bacterium]
MKLKANLHFHSKENSLDIIEYNLFDGIDKAVELGFNVLAVTCYNKFIITDHHKKYAAEKGILLIPGIEINIHEKWTKNYNRVVVLGCDETATTLHTFEDLKRYRAEHPEIFIFVPCQYLFERVDFKKLVEKHIDLFDAIELSWFYTLWFNPNTGAAKIAEKFNKPFVATSDARFLRFINTGFTTIETEEKTLKSIFKALRSFKYENTTTPRTLFEIIFIFGYYKIRSTYKKIKRNIRMHFQEKKKYVTSYRNEA